MNLKQLWPTLVPVAGALLTAVLPSLQHAMAHAFAAELIPHPAVATLVGAVVVALYHALPSPLQK